MPFFLLHSSPAIVPLFLSALHMANASFDKTVQLVCMVVPLHVAAVHLNLRLLAWCYVLPAVFFTVLGVVGQLVLEYVHRNAGQTKRHVGHQQR